MGPGTAIAVLVALLVGLAAGKAWERYKLQDGRWIDRRRASESPHYMLGLNFLVADQIDPAIEELTKAAQTAGDALEIHHIRDMANLLARISGVDPDVILIDLENPSRDTLVPSKQPRTCQHHGGEKAYGPDHTNTPRRQRVAASRWSGAP